MISKEQYESELKKEAEFNKLFDKVANKSPFGKWYGYMVSASNMLTKNLPKQVAIYHKDGRPFVVYKSDVGKLAGVWGTATHKVVSSDLSHKKYGKAILDVLGVGHITETYKQTHKKGYTLYDLSPEDVKKLWKQKVIEKNPHLKDTIELAEKLDSENIIKTKKQKEKHGILYSFLQKLFGTYKH